MRKLLLLILLLFPLPALADLEAHFLDVGHGDCCIIICDGEAMIIDGGISSCSQQIYNYIKSHDITQIKYAVASHPDADHVGGLPAAFRAANVQALLSPVAEHDEKRFNTLLHTAEEYNVPVMVPKAGDVFQLGGAQITVISPVIQFADINDLSLVLRIDYGVTSFIFTGDASSSVERDLIARQAALDADVLKVSHHGSSTGTSASFVKAISPEYAIISCSDDSDYPSREALYNLSDIRTLITAQKGTIIIRSTGKQLSVSYDRLSEEMHAALFVGNKNSKVFHRNDCESVAATKDKNKVFFESSEQAEQSGYRPCKNCNP